MKLVPLSEKYYKEIESWFSDATNNLNKYMSVYKDMSRIGGLVGSDRYMWVAKVGDEIVGVFDAEVKGDSASTALFIKPSKQGRGLGTQLMKLGLEQPELKSLKTIWGGVANDNIASIKLLELFGFEPRKSKVEGMTDYILTRKVK